MRNFQMKRQRGRNRGGNQGGGGAKPQNANRAFDSNGPDGIKVRGHAQHVYEKYQQLARDAASAGDRVLAENYLQHAEHYFRTIRALQPNKPVTEIVGRETFASGFDIDFEDESVVAAIEATDAAAMDREQNGQPPLAEGGGDSFEAGQNQPNQGAQNAGQQGQNGQGQNGQGQNGQGQNGQGQGGQGRQWEPRSSRNDRYQNDRQQQGGGDRPRYENRDRDDRQPGGGERPRYDREDRGQGGDRPRYENRDRQPYNREDRAQGDRPRYDREDRGDRVQGDRVQGERAQGDRAQGERTQGDRFERPRYDRDRSDPSERSERSEPATDTSAAPASEGAAPGRMLRSEDGGVSHAPAFLQGAVAAPAFEGEEPAAKPRRRRKPKAEGAPDASED